MADAGIAHVRYLADFFIAGSTGARTWASAHLTTTIIKTFELALSLEKVEGPLQRLDSVKETMAISSARQAELTQFLTAFRSRNWTSPRHLQSLLGKLVFAGTVPPGARPFTRRIIDTFVVHRRGRVQLDDGFRSDVDFWLTHMATWNDRAQRRPS
jgi:hypothetical protein